MRRTGAAACWRFAERNSGGGMEDVGLPEIEDVGIELVEESDETEQFVFVRIRLII
jgi:hypothetical protein